MSEIMQNSRYKGKKFVEGRLKLSTSCTECHRRKQKCDQQQPCRHCSRRFPQPPCVYRKIKDNSAPAEASKSTELEQKPNEPSSDPNPGKGKVIENRAVAISLPRPPSYDAALEELRTGNDGASPTPSTSVSMEKLGEFDSHSYQNLLSSMVSVLCSEADFDLEGSGREEIQAVYGPKKVSPGFSKSSLNKSASGRHVQKIKQEAIYERKVPTPSRFSITSVDPLHFLGITPTTQSGELLHAFVTIIVKYPFSVDGKPSPNYYNDYWVPWTVKVPILAYMGIFTSACYQAEIMKIPPSKSPIVLSYKVKIINMLNEMLNSPQTATSIEAVVVVIYMMTNEWYWSNYESAQAHMKGLKEMVRLRGGIDEFGMGDFVKRMILLNDYYLACSYNADPHFSHTITLTPHHPPHMGTPFIASDNTFLSTVDALQISPETAIILDDMRFLISSILLHISTVPSELENVKFQTTARWVFDKISALTDGSIPESPLARDHIYKSVLIAALIFCRAITTRSPLSKVCSFIDLQKLWANMWKVTLSRWKEIPGVFLFIILAAIPAAQETPHGRFLKSMLKTTSAYISLENWDVVDSTLMSFVYLQRWLRGGEVGGAAVDGSPKSLAFVHFYRS